MAKQKFYVVFEGRETGIFTDYYGEVEPLVKGFSGCMHAKYKTRQEAQAALDDYTTAQAELFEAVELTEVNLDGIFDGSDDDCPF